MYFLEIWKLWLIEYTCVQLHIHVYISILNCVFSLQLPTGAVPMFGGGANPLAAAIKKQRKQESDEVNKTGSL